MFILLNSVSRIIVMLVESIFPHCGRIKSNQIKQQDSIALQVLDISKIRWIVNHYNFDIFGCRCGCIISTKKKIALKTLPFSRKIEYENLPVLPVNFDKIQIAPMAIQW